MNREEAEEQLEKAIRNTDWDIDDVIESVYYDGEIILEANLRIRIEED